MAVRLIKLLFIAVALIGAGAAQANDRVRVAKAQGSAWTFLPVDIGIEQGIFAKYDLDPELSVLPGDAKFQQALISRSIDIGLASGTSMALAVKGSPAVAVAAYAGPPRNFSVNVAADSDIKTVKDLKGRLLATATAGSLPEWLI